MKRIILRALAPFLRAAAVAVVAVTWREQARSAQRPGRRRAEGG